MNLVPQKLYKITEKDIDKAAKVLFEAFKDDFTNRRLLENEKQYDQSLLGLFKLFLIHNCKNGYTFADSQELNGVSIWQYSSKTRISPWDFITKGGLKHIFKTHPKTLYRLNKIDKYLRQRQKNIMPQEHIYLSLLGVNPNVQSNGIGTKIMKLVLNEVDKLKAPCYLGVRKERNISFYEKFGFEVKQELILPILNIPSWIMTRN